MALRSICSHFHQSQSPRFASFLFSVSRWFYFPLDFIVAFLHSFDYRSLRSLEDLPLSLKSLFNLLFRLTFTSVFAYNLRSLIPTQTTVEWTQMIMMLLLKRECASELVRVLCTCFNLIQCKNAVACCCCFFCADIAFS